MNAIAVCTSESNHTFEISMGSIQFPKGMFVEQSLQFEHPRVGLRPGSTPALRPAYSLLECSQSRQALGCPAQHWRSALEEVLHAVEI